MSDVVRAPMLAVWQKLSDMQALAASLRPEHLPALQVALVHLENTVAEAKKAWRKSKLVPTTLPLKDS